MTTPNGETEGPRVGPPLLPDLNPGHEISASPPQKTASSSGGPPPLPADPASPGAAAAAVPAGASAAPPLLRPGAAVSMPGETRSTPASHHPTPGLTSTYGMEDYRLDTSAHPLHDDAAPAPTFTPALEPAPEPLRRPRPTPTYRPVETRFDLDADELPPRGPSLAERLRTDPGARWVALACVAVLAAGILLTMRKVDPSVAIATLKRHPEAMDGKTVTVKGRIGEVFQMGSSYAYYLHQGRDTIAVFTRTRTPIPREKVTVTGSISTGYLDGMPRLGLFEGADSK